ncbi:hypothetical protein MLD38_026865 [Melastoma candidum]|nr:hypothetical protein MLD38_026865 [Melastoma candidum]
MSMANDDISGAPLSMLELVGVLEDEEGLAVKELVDSSVLFDVMGWTSSEAKLDLHGMHLGSAFVILLQWMDEMRRRLNNERHSVPNQITVICGAGKHSKVRGESPVKQMVKRVLNRLRSPMRIDMRNTGCFICKGRALKQWLCPSDK